MRALPTVRQAVSGEAIAKCCPNFWPLGRDHAVPGGVAPGAVGQRHVSAMDALKLRGQRLHRRARPSVASVGLEFDALTVELLERPTTRPGPVSAAVACLCSLLGHPEHGGDRSPRVPIGSGGVHSLG